MAEPDFSSEHYRTENGVVLIDIRLHTVAQLFNSLDPAPFREKDLEHEAEDYIVGSANDFPVYTPLKLVVHLPADQVGTPGAAAIEDAIHHFFAYSLAAERRRLRAYLREGRVSLLIGLAMLFVCVGLRQLLTALGDGTLEHILAEGFLIVGWVAMWHPIDTFVFGWWPARRRGRIYAKLAEVPVELRPS
jgi:hypothetical protein